MPYVALESTAELLMVTPSGPIAHLGNLLAAKCCPGEVNQQ